MWVESDGPGHGLDLLLHDRGADRRAAAEQRAATFIGVQPELQGKRVLVVDDNATNRRILALQTGKWGMASRDTESPAEALRWLEAGRALRPRDPRHAHARDGRRRRWRGASAPAAPTLPLVLFSSLGRREAGDAESLFNAYLAKPLHQSQLFDTLVSLLAHDARREAAPPRRRPSRRSTRRWRRAIRCASCWPRTTSVNQKLALRLLQQMGYRADLASQRHRGGRVGRSARPTTWC